MTRGLDRIGVRTRRARLLVASLTIAGGTASWAYGCTRTNPRAAPPEVRTVTTVRHGKETVVTITDELPEPENPACIAYCERMATCWYALPTGDVLASSGETRARCLAEQHGCRTPSTDTFCCSEHQDCLDFSRCQTTSRGAPADCARLRITAGRQR